MPREIHWTDAEEIGIQLQEKFPDLDPLTVRFTDLHRYVTELEGFADDPPNRTSRGLKPFRWPGTRSPKTRKADSRLATSRPLVFAPAERASKCTNSRVLSRHKIYADHIESHRRHLRLWQLAHIAARQTAQDRCACVDPPQLRPASCHVRCASSLRRSTASVLATRSDPHRRARRRKTSAAPPRYIPCAADRRRPHPRRRVPSSDAPVARHRARAARARRSRPSEGLLQQRRSASAPIRPMAIYSAPAAACPCKRAHTHRPACRAKRTASIDAMPA